MQRLRSAEAAERGPGHRQIAVIRASMLNLARRQVSGVLASRTSVATTHGPVLLRMPAIANDLTGADEFNTVCLHSILSEKCAPIVRREVVFGGIASRVGRPSFRLEAQRRLSFGKACSGESRLDEHESTN